MSVTVLDTMGRGLTPAYSRGMERIDLALGPMSADGTTKISAYGFTAYQNLYDGRLPASPRYLLVPAAASAESRTVRVWFTRQMGGAEDPVDVGVPAGWAAGRGIAIPIPGPAASITNELRLTRFQPQPPASQASADWAIVALLGNLAKLLWIVGVEHQELAVQAADVVAQRSAATAHGASLDLLGQDLGVPRFPPTPYTWDPDTLALYHLDDVPTPSQTEVTTVVDDRSRYQAKSHPAQNNGAQSRGQGRFGGAFSFTQGNASISVPDDPEFALPAGSPFTVEAVIKPDPSATAPGAVIAKRSQLNAPAAPGWALSVGSYRGVQGNVRFALGDGSNEIELFADRDLDDGVFHHVAGVIDPRGGTPPLTFAVVYVDGAEVARQGLVSLGALTNSQPVTIGFGGELVSGSATDAPYRGLIDEVRISKVARSAFHPVVGEGDDQYVRRLEIFQGWLLPTPDALQSALNRLVGPVNGDPSPFIIDETVDPGTIGTESLRVLPAPLAPGACIAADGDQRTTEQAAAGSPDDEPDFDPAWLRRHPDQGGISFGTAENNRLMQTSVAVALDALRARLTGGTLTVVKAYDPLDPGLHRVGRAVVLSHDAIVAADLTVQAFAVGFAWVCHTGTDQVYASQPRAEIFRITPLDSGQQPQPPDVVEGQPLGLGLDPDPSAFADAEVSWSLIHCGRGDGALAPGNPTTLHATAAGNLTVQVDVTRRRHTGAGTRTIRIGLADTGLAAGQSIGGDGRRGVTEADAAGQPSPDFSELYLQTRTDDLSAQAAKVDYGTDLGNRRMQRVTGLALDRLLTLIASAPGKLSVVKAFDPAGTGLVQQGRALWLRHSQLATSALAARAFAAGFAYVRIEPGPPLTLQVAVAEGEQIEVTGPNEVQVGQSIELVVAPQAAPSAVWFATDGSHAYVADHGSHRVTAFSVTAASAAAFPTMTLSGSAAVAPTPLALAFAGGHLYVAHELPGTISVLDPTTLAVTTSITTGPHPSAIAADGNRVFVACAGDSTLHAYDTAGNQEVAKLTLPGAPSSVALAPGGSSLYVVIAGNRFCQVNRANLQLVGAPVATGAGAVSAALSPDGTKLYVACASDDVQNNTGNVHVYATATNQQTAVVGGFPPQRPPAVLTVAADQKHVFVATTATAPATGEVHVIDAVHDTLVAAMFTPGGTSQGLATSTSGAAFAPCLLSVSGDAAAVTLGDPAPLGLNPPRAPRIALSVALGTGAGELLAWSTVPFSRGNVQLTSLVKPVDHALGATAGATLVRAMYIRGGNLRPYQFEVRLNATLDAQPGVTLRKDEFDLVMNILNSFHPLGVEVLTPRLRAHVLELSQAGSDLSPSYTYPVFHNRALSLPQPTNLP